MSRAYGRSLWRPPPLPREYGSWSMLVIPLVLAVAASGRLAPASLLIVPAMILIFLARYAAIPAATRWIGGKSLPSGYASRRFFWTGAYVAACACFLAAAAAGSSARLATLVAALITGALGITNAGLALIGRDRSLVAELIGLAGLASSAPLVMVAAGRPLDEAALGVAALCFGYFVSTLSFVRAWRNLERARAAALAGCLAAHILAVVALIALTIREWLPPAAPLAFAAPLVRTVWGLRRPAATLRDVGWWEMVVAVGFLVVGAVVLAP